MDANEAFDELKKELFARFFEKNPHLATYLGLHDPYDYLLPKGDTAHILGNLKTLEDHVERMKKTVNYDPLNDANKTDWQVLENPLGIGQIRGF